MVRFLAASAAIALVVLPVTGASAHGGDRMPAGGAFMSSYGTSPSAQTPWPGYRGMPADPVSRAAPDSTGSLRPAVLPLRREGGRHRTR
jgi:hypothetical protein